MDYIQKVNEISKGLTVREMQEREKVLQTQEQKKYPYKNSSKVAVGEYFPTLEDKINLIRYMSDHPTMPSVDKKILEEALTHIPTYEKKGFQFGLINAFFIYFAPGVRRLAFYKRIPVTLPFLLLWTNWGYNYGRDLTFVKSRNYIENWERDMGFRHFQTGF